MTTQEQYIARLKEMVTAKFGREVVTKEDYTALAEAVREVTDGTIDERSIELIFGSKSRSIAPRPVTLSTLARYVGFNGWSDFCSSRNVIPADDTDVIPVTRRWGVILLTIAAILVVVSSALYLLLYTPTHTSSPTSESITPLRQCLFASVDDKWRAIATEECIDMRTYSSAENYTERVEELIARSTATLELGVATDIANLATDEGIEVNSEAIEEYKSEIIERCLNIYNCLRNETAPLQ